MKNAPRFDRQIKPGSARIAAALRFIHDAKAKKGDWGHFWLLIDELGGCEGSSGRRMCLNCRSRS
jgi:hypothetical protein